MNKVIIIAAGLCMLVPFRVFSQEMLMRKKVSEDMFDSDIGPNKKHFGHLYSGFSLFVGSAEAGAGSKQLLSNAGKVGYRYKYKLTEWYSLGASLYYKNWSWNLKQNDSKTLPNTIQHDKEKLVYQQAGLEFYQRLNFFMRGNFMGLYWDAGPYINYAWQTKHMIVDKVDTGEYHSGKREVTYSRLDYTNPFNYGLNIRVGYGNFSLVMSYRISSLYTNAYSDLPELPKFDMGLQLGFF